MTDPFIRTADKPVVFIDSGVGGLHYLRWVRDNAPDESLVYIADTLNFPYGEKRASHVQTIVVSLVDQVVKSFDPKLIVVACNTASVVALGALRNLFSVPFVGVVPAVKPAATLSKSKFICVLGSSRTVEDAYTADLIAYFASECRVISVSGREIIDFVETRFPGSSEDERELAVRNTLSAIHEEGVDTLVLACTHFLYLEEEFRKVCGAAVTVIDSREGVGRQVLKLLRRDNSPAAGQGRGTCFQTGGAAMNGHYTLFAEMFDLDYLGVFP